MTAPPGTAWVVGATGFWGRKVSLSLLRRGWRIVALNRTEPRELRQWAEAQGRSFTWQPFDLSNPDWEALASLPDPQAVFYCAAVFDATDFARMMTANAVHGVRLLEMAITRMPTGGRVGLFLGQNGRLGLPGLAPFSATQGALWTWAEGKQRELAGGPIRMSLVFPPRAPSELQRQLTSRLARPPRVKTPKTADPLVAGVLAGKKRVGRTPWLAALAMLAS